MSATFFCLTICKKKKIHSFLDGFNSPVDKHRLLVKCKVSYFLLRELLRSVFILQRSVFKNMRRSLFDFFLINKFDVLSLNIKLKYPYFLLLGK